MKYIFLLFGIFMTACTPNSSKYYPKQELTDIRSTIKEKDLPPSCKGLTKIIKEQWFYDNKNNYYVHDRSFVSNIQQYMPCLKALSPNQIRGIFGQPSHEVGDKINRSLCYYSDTLCYYNQNCISLSFFSRDGKKIYVLGYGGGNCSKKINMKTAIILMSFLLIVGCTPTIQRRISKLPTKNLPTECKELNSTVYNGFFHLKGQNYFIMSGHTLEDILFMPDCISKLSCDEIKLIFGEPSLETEEKIYYYLSSKKYSNNTRSDVLTFYKKNDLMIDKVTIEPLLEE